MLKPHIIDMLIGGQVDRIETTSRIRWQAEMLSAYPVFAFYRIKATPHNSKCTACLNIIPSACPKNLGKATALPQFICAT